MKELFKSLNSFDINKRLSALREIDSKSNKNLDKKRLLNMHMHTFFSFNGENHSPARLLWEAKQAEIGRASCRERV